MDEGDELDGLEAIARAIRWLGNADAATPMGGLEALGLAIKEGNESIATSISELAAAVSKLAQAMSEARR